MLLLKQPVPVVSLSSVAAADVPQQTEGALSNQQQVNLLIQLLSVLSHVL